MKTKCLFCNSEVFTPSWQRPTFYNQKVFTYNRCAKCHLIVVHPLPNAGDLEQMYPASYQGGADKTICVNEKLPGLRFSYEDQFDLVRKHVGQPARILDYGCGNGNFIVNAIHENFRCDGTEFGEKQVEILKKEIPGSTFYRADLFLLNQGQSYDVIRLSNVLEHLTNPAEVIRILSAVLSKNGILLVEGPIEANFSLAFMTRKIAVLLKTIFSAKKYENHSVAHVFLSDRKNQEEFFKSFGFETLTFRIAENAWPYPDSISAAKGTGNKLKAVIAAISIGASRLFPQWGNTFLYIGRKKL